MPKSSAAHGVVHASDAEVVNELIAQVHDSILGVDVSLEDGSPYKHLFGGSYLGKPRSGERPVGYPTGNPGLTATARRRAMRVLKAVYAREFEHLMRQEVAYLEEHPDEIRKG